MTDTDIPSLIERLRVWARRDVMHDLAADALSTLTASPLPGEVEKAIAEMKSPRAISHEGRAERVCALLERMAREIERLKTWSDEMAIQFRQQGASDAQARIRQLEAERDAIKRTATEALMPFKHWYELNDCDGRAGVIEVPITDLRNAREAIRALKPASEDGKE